MTTTFQQVMKELFELTYKASEPSIDINTHKGKINPADHRIQEEDYARIKAELQKKYPEHNLEGFNFAMAYINQGAKLVPDYGDYYRCVACGEAQKEKRLINDMCKWCFSNNKAIKYPHYAKGAEGEF